MDRQPNLATQSKGNSLNIALFICRTWAVSLDVFLHRDLGERYLGLQAAAVLLLVPLYSLFWERYDLRPLMEFLLAYLVMCLIARAGMWGGRRRGEHCHSLYTGWPRFLGPKAKITELTMKRFVEPGVTFLFGWAVREEMDAPLGAYLMIGACCLFISMNLWVTVERCRALDIHDAVIEQERTAERFREMRGER